MTESLWESLARVTLASVGGGLAGLAVAKQHRRRPPYFNPGRGSKRKHPPIPTNGGTSSKPRNIPRQRPMGPPAAAAAAAQILPRQWALSCFLFTVLLETSRLTSPTTLIYQQYLQALTNKPDDANAKKRTSSSSSTNLATNQVALFVASDYTIGGLVAGGAAALRGQGSSSLSVASRLGSGTIIGALLGFTAGMIQAGVVWAEAQLTQTTKMPEATDSVSRLAKESS